MAIHSPKIVRRRSIVGQGEICRIFVASRIGRDWKLNDQSVSNPWLANVLRNMESEAGTLHKWLYAVGPPVILTGPKSPSNFQGAFRLEGPFAD